MQRLESTKIALESELDRVSDLSLSSKAQGQHEISALIANHEQAMTSLKEQHNLEDTKMRESHDNAIALLKQDKVRAHN